MPCLGCLTLSRLERKPGVNFDFSLKVIRSTGEKCQRHHGCYLIRDWLILFVANLELLQAVWPR